MFVYQRKIAELFANSSNTKSLIRLTLSIGLTQAPSQLQDF